MAETHEPSACSHTLKLALTVRDVASALNVSERTVWRLSDRGELPAPFRIGRAVRWRRSTIEAWLAKRERQALRQ